LGTVGEASHRGRRARGVAEERGLLLAGLLPRQLGNEAAWCLAAAGECDADAVEDAALSPIDGCRWDAVIVEAGHELADSLRGVGHCFLFPPARPVVFGGGAPKPSG